MAAAYALRVCSGQPSIPLQLVESAHPIQAAVKLTARQSGLGPVRP